MKQLIETIVKPLVDHPGDVKVDKDEQHHRVTYKLSVNPEDMGKGDREAGACRQGDTNYCLFSSGKSPR